MIMTNTSNNKSKVGKFIYSQKQKKGKDYFLSFNFLLISPLFLLINVGVVSFYV